MSRKALGIGVVAIAAVAGTAWFAMRDGKAVVEAPVAVASPAPQAVAAPPMPAPTVAEAAPLPEVEIAPPPSIPARAVERDFTASSTVHTAAIPPAPSVSAFGGRDIMDADDLAELLAEYGGWPNLYRAATSEERAELIVALDLGDGGVRGQIGGLLGLETDSDLRAMMISRTDPEGFFDEALEEAPVDEELIALLRAEAATPVERDEWIARMQVASLAQEAFGVEMTRRAIAEYPDDAVVRLWASALQLSLNRMVEGVEPQEAASAENFLFAQLGGEGAGRFSANERIQGYSALLFSSDPAVARDFLRDRIDRDPDPQAQATLRQLVELLDKVAG